MRLLLPPEFILSNFYELIAGDETAIDSLPCNYYSMLFLLSNEWKASLDKLFPKFPASLAWSIESEELLCERCESSSWSFYVVTLAPPFRLLIRFCIIIILSLNSTGNYGLNSNTKCYSYFIKIFFGALLVIKSMKNDRIYLILFLNLKI